MDLPTALDVAADVATVLGVLVSFGALVARTNKKKTSPWFDTWAQNLREGFVLLEPPQLRLRVA